MTQVVSLLQKVDNRNAKLHQVSVWIARKLAFCAFTFCSAGTHAHASWRKTQVWAVAETQVSSYYTHRFTYPPTRTVSFKKLYAPFQCKSWNNQPIASCAYCSCLKMLRKTVHKQKLLKQSINGTQSIVTAISILTASAFSLNYQWQNAFNPLQCSIQFVFNVVHLPTNQQDIKTEHSNWLLQTQ